LVTESILKELYGENEIELQRQRDRYQNLLDQHKQIFKTENVKIISTPGRTEIGGNHTDHNHGKVLAGSINLDSIAVTSISDTNLVTLYSEGYDKPFVVNLNNLLFVPNEKGTTSALIRGIAARIVEMGYKIGGFNAMVSSDVLPGSGLSSSASIEVLIGTIFNSLFNENKIPAEDLAKTGQYAENLFFGKPCGLMDQMACAMGGIISIDFKNPQEPIMEKIEYDLEKQGFGLVVVNTKGNHEDLTDDYAAIPNEMKAVASKFGKEVCRDVKIEELLPQINAIRARLGDRAVLRALHFLQENERVSKQVQALKENDFKAFLSLVRESGDSSFKWLQNIFAVSKVHEQGVSLGLALSELYIKQIGEGASRVHGGGFAGTIQVFLPKDKIEGYRKIIEPVFGEDSIYILNIRKHGTIDISSL
jgi:galactokinase